MANKNTAGNTLVRSMAKEDRLIEKIDYRDKKGVNMENIDDTYSNYHIEEGARVWSF